MQSFKKSHHFRRRIETFSFDFGTSQFSFVTLALVLNQDSFFHNCTLHIMAYCITVRLRSYNQQRAFNFDNAEERNEIE